MSTGKPWNLWAPGPRPNYLLQPPPAYAVRQVGEAARVTGYSPSIFLPGAANGFPWVNSHQYGQKTDRSIILSLVFVKECLTNKHGRVKILQHGQVNTIPPLPLYKSSCTAGVFPLNLRWDEGACHSYTLASESTTRTAHTKNLHSLKLT